MHMYQSLYRGLARFCHKTNKKKFEINNRVKLREAAFASSKIIGSSVLYGILICDSVVSGGSRRAERHPIPPAI